jgi:hypothetical protein
VRQVYIYPVLLRLGSKLGPNWDQIIFQKKPDPEPDSKFHFIFWEEIASIHFLELEPKVLHKSQEPRIFLFIYLYLYLFIFIYLYYKYT